MKYCSGYPKFTSDEKGFISYFGVERPYLYNNHTLTIFPLNTLPLYHHIVLDPVIQIYDLLWAITNRC